MSRTMFESATRARPCEICQGNHKCSRGEDGLIMCGRQRGQLDGYAYLGQAKGDEQFGMYRRQDDPELARRQEERDADHASKRRAHGQSANGPNGTHHGNGDGTGGEPTSLIDWTKRAQSYARKLTKERRAELGEALGLPDACLDALGPIGYSENGVHKDEDSISLGRCWTFPERNATGDIIGITARYGGGQKKAYPGGRRGLSIPSRWDERDGPVFLPEGPSDTLALTAMNLAAIGRPSNTGGVDALTELLRTIPPARLIVVLAEYDPKKTGKWPGLDGAIKTAQELTAKLGRPVQWALPPDGSKDVRAWFLAQRPDLTLADGLQEFGQKLRSILEGQLQDAGKSETPTGGCTASAVETFTAADLATMTLPEPRFAVPGILPEGMSVLAGKPKLGKSWLALNLCIGVATGGVALGSFRVEGGSCLYLALEDTKRRLQGRLAKLLQAQECQAPATLTLATTWPRQDMGGLKAIAAWLDEHPDARLIVVDTWPKFRPPKMRGQDDYTQDYAHASEVKALADERGVATLILAHCRKMEASDPVDSVSGTLGLTGCADAVLVLKRERGQHDAALFVTGRDIDEQELALRWDAQWCLWSVIGQADEYRMSQERAEIIAVLKREARAMKPSEVAPLVGKGSDAVRLTLWRMANAGHILSVGGGRYECVSATECNGRNNGNAGDEYFPNPFKMES